MQDTPDNSPLWAKKLAEHLEDEGYDLHHVLKDCHLPLTDDIDVDLQVPFGNIARFFEACARVTHDDLTGFRFGTHIDVRDAGLLAFIGLYSHSLRDGILNTARYARVFGDAVSFDVGSLDHVGRLGYTLNVPVSVETQQYAEWFASGTLAGYRAATQRTIKCLSVRFRHFRTTNLEAMTRYFGCIPEFGATENAFYFAKPDLATLIPASDSKLLAYLEAIAEETIKRRSN